MKWIYVKPRPVIPSQIIHEFCFTWYEGGTWLSCDPQTILFSGLGGWNRYFGHSKEKKKSSHSSKAGFLVFFSFCLFVCLFWFIFFCEFCSSYALFFNKRWLLLLSQRFPTFAFQKSQEFFEPDNPLLFVKCCDSCILDFLRLSFSFSRTSLRHFA